MACYCSECLKGQHVALERKSKLFYWINEVITQRVSIRINELLSEEQKVPEQCVMLERWRGPPRMNTVNGINCVVVQVL